MKNKRYASWNETFENFRHALFTGKACYRCGTAMILLCYNNKHYVNQIQWFSRPICYRSMGYVQLSSSLYKPRFQRGK
jgi:hypothetical protein